MKALFMKEKLKIITVVSTLFGLSTGISGCDSETKSTVVKQEIVQSNDRLATVEQDVEALLSKMTLPEKVSLNIANHSLNAMMNGL